MTITGFVQFEEWRYHKPFVISRESIVSSTLAVVSLEEEGAVGRGEACPTPYFGDSVDGVHALIETLTAALVGGGGWDTIQDRTPAGGARKAVGCARWDVRRKRTEGGRRGRRWEGKGKTR